MSRVKEIVLKNLIIMLLGFCSLAACAADPWCSKSGADTMKFEWVPKNRNDPHVGSVQVKDARNGQILQVIENLDRYGSDFYPLRTEDLNNDGCGDLVVLSDLSSGGNSSNTVFLYNRKSKRFIYSGELSSIGGLDGVAPRNKNCVNSFWKFGMIDSYAVQYCWKNGKLMMRKEESVSALVDKEGAPTCIEHVTTTYRDGKKKTKKTCIKPSRMTA